MQIPDNIKQFIGEPSKIDYNDTKQLVEDLWLFLAHDSNSTLAAISKEAFAHEVGVMIDTVRCAAIQDFAAMDLKQLLKLHAVLNQGNAAKTAGGDK